MTVLVLKLAGPLQSWGTDSKFDKRSSGTEPSKSGVIGMIASAMGRDRDDSVEDLAKLRFGIRVDQPGRIVTDFHTAHSRTDSYVTYRQYISDAIFLVMIEGEHADLAEIDAAMNNPAHPLFLGRRSCPPSGKLSLGLYESHLEEMLSTYPWQASDWYRRSTSKEVSLETIIDSDNGNSVVRDTPLSFSQSHRKHAHRTVKRSMSLGRFDNPFGREPRHSTEHDAMSTLREA